MGAHLMPEPPANVHEFVMGQREKSPGKVVGGSDRAVFNNALINATVSAAWMPPTTSPEERSKLIDSILVGMVAFNRKMKSRACWPPRQWRCITGLSISVENFPGNSVQKFPVDCLPGSYGLCRLGWNGSTGVSRPKSAVSRVQSL